MSSKSSKPLDCKTHLLQAPLPMAMAQASAHPPLDDTAAMALALDDATAAETTKTLDDDALELVFAHLHWEALLLGAARCADRSWRAAAKRVSARRHREIVDALARRPSASRQRHVDDARRAASALYGLPTAAVAERCARWFSCDADDEDVSREAFALLSARRDDAATYANFNPMEEATEVLSFIRDVLAKRRARSAFHLRLEGTGGARSSQGTACADAAATRRACDAFHDDVLAGFSFSDRALAVSKLAGPIGAARGFLRVFAGLHDAVGGAAHVHHLRPLDGPAKVTLVLDRARLLLGFEWDRADVRAARAPLCFFARVQDLV